MENRSRSWIFKEMNLNLENRKMQYPNATDKALSIGSEMHFYELSTLKEQELSDSYSEKLVKEVNDVTLRIRNQNIYGNDLAKTMADKMNTASTSKMLDGLTGRGANKRYGNALGKTMADEMNTASASKMLTSLAGLESDKRKRYGGALGKAMADGMNTASASKILTSLTGLESDRRKRYGGALGKTMADEMNTTSASRMLNDFRFVNSHSSATLIKRVTESAMEGLMPKQINGLSATTLKGTKAFTGISPKLLNEWSAKRVGPRSFIDGFDTTISKGTGASRGYAEKLVQAMNTDAKSSALAITSTSYLFGSKHGGRTELDAWTHGGIINRPNRTQLSDFSKETLAYHAVAAKHSEKIARAVTNVIEPAYLENPSFYVSIGGVLTTPEQVSEDQLENTVVQRMEEKAFEELSAESTLVVTRDELLSFRDFLLATPSFALKTDVGNRIYEYISEKKIDRVTIDVPLFHGRPRKAGEDEFSRKELDSAAPFGISGEGRFNVANNNLYYTSDNLQTLTSELKLKPGEVFDALRFKVKQPLGVLDLTKGNKMILGFCLKKVVSGMARPKEYMISQFIGQCAMANPQIQVIKVPSVANPDATNYIFLDMSMRDYVDESSKKVNWGLS